jgi:heme/copper-type cytochrome/quinol oxidase subunit 2
VDDAMTLAVLIFVGLWLLFGLVSAALFLYRLAKAEPPPPNVNRIALVFVVFLLLILILVAAPVLFAFGKLRKRKPAQ